MKNAHRTRKQNAKSKRRTMRMKGGDNYDVCEAIKASIDAAFAKYEYLPIMIDCDVTKNEEDRSKPYISFVIYKKGTFATTKEQICFESLIYPFPNSTMISRSPTISIGNSCSIYVKPCSDELGVSTILKELSPILIENNIHSVNVGDCSVFIYKNDTTNEMINFATKYLYKIRYNRSFYSYYLLGPSRYMGIPISDLPEDIVWDESILPARESVQNTSELAEQLQNKLNSLCMNKTIEDGLLICVVSNENWELLLSIIHLIEQIYNYVFRIVPFVESPKEKETRKLEPEQSLRRSTRKRN